MERGEGRVAAGGVGCLLRVSDDDVDEREIRRVQNRGADICSYGLDVAPRGGIKDDVYFDAPFAVSVGLSQPVNAGIGEQQGHLADAAAVQTGDTRNAERTVADGFPDLKGDGGPRHDY